MTDESLSTAAFRVIHIRSRIAEALLNEAYNNTSPEYMADILKAAFKTADAIEHIAEDGFNRKVLPVFLIQSLETALYIMDSLKIPLSRTTLKLPTENEIRFLIQSLKSTQ